MEFIEGDLPPGWIIKTLDDLAIRVGSGITPTGGNDAYTKDGVLFIRSQNVRNEGLDLSDAVYIDNKTHQAMARSEVLPSDVLLNITGASIGRCCVVPNGLGVTNQNQHVCTIRLAEANVENASLLSAILRSPIGQQQISRLNAGGNREGLNYQQIRTFSVPWPPEKERKYLSQVLTTLDAVIAKTETVLAKLRQVKAGMLHDLLNCGLDENGELRDPLRHPEQFKDSEFGEIPKDWSVVTIGMLAFFQNGYCFKSQNWEKSGLPIIRIQNLNQNNEFNYHRGPIQEEWHIFPGDLLFAWAGQRKSSFGPRIWNGPEAVLNQHIFKVVPQEHLVSKQFLNILLNVNLSRIEDCAHGFKQSFLHVPKCDLVGVKVCLPKIDEQDRIENILTCYDNKIESNSASLSKLLRLKQGLLHDLLTGHVRVPPHLLEATS